MMADDRSERLNAETCKTKAEDCRMLAKQAKISEHRIMLLHMAETWDRIANTYENGK